MNYADIEKAISALGEKVGFSQQFSSCLIVRQPCNFKMICFCFALGKNKRTSNRGHGWRHVHHLEWGSFRLHDGHTHHKPAPVLHLRNARHYRQTCSC